ncbi:lysine 2,3-aminomutase [Streptomyces sp. ML-6]|uniref:KamA family radical SAM protein n=1 Tax=Streptomyces sp. ML-6 TaxID=2982693 RepID=UPI0024BF6AC4|nr:lysine 2,3-aminomutase [Streptomyces sp. ML-6]MDK0517998.1 lysine 2,3-aminomutase [Streptomyces sp. ML-6]
MNRRIAQPYTYRGTPLVEPDWRRFPGWGKVTRAEWESPNWQRRNSVRNPRQLRSVLGDTVDDSFYTDLDRDRLQRATMSLLLTPQMLNTMAARVPATGPGSLTDAFYEDPVRRYMLPVFSDRRADWPSHPRARRDSLHEQEMWAVEGLTHRYPTKVLAELLSTCPQYCGHCTRMDLVGASTPQVDKRRFRTGSRPRMETMLGYLRQHPEVRDVVVSGGDVANIAWPRLEWFVEQLIAIPGIRDIRLASKALVGLPQYWLSGEVLSGLERLAKIAAGRGVQIALHTHANAAASVTPLVAQAARAVLATGIRDVRNQGVLMRGVNGTAEEVLDLCFALLDEAGIMPYYFYQCDMVPCSEHWRMALWEARDVQDRIMGYLPGFATPRIVCDVPYVGKRWVHQAIGYDRVSGISHWAMNHHIAVEGGCAFPKEELHEFYDPIHTLPTEGQLWWEKHDDAVHTS